MQIVPSFVELYLVQLHDTSKVLASLCDKLSDTHGVDFREIPTNSELRTWSTRRRTHKPCRLSGTNKLFSLFSVFSAGEIPRNPIGFASSQVQRAQAIDIEVAAYVV